MVPWQFVAQDQFATVGHDFKLKSCPFCRRVGTLNLHGYLRGQDEKDHLSVRARRIYCSDRTRRPGCGRTFSLFLSHCLIGLKVGTATAWAFLSGILAGLSIEKAVYAVAARHDLSLSTFWRLWQKLKGAQAAVRSLPKAINDYNHRPHTALFGLTPHEVFHGAIPNRRRYKIKIAEAVRNRLADNMKTHCKPEKTPPCE